MFECRYRRLKNGSGILQKLNYVNMWIKLTEITDQENKLAPVKRINWTCWHEDDQLPSYVVPNPNSALRPPSYMSLGCLQMGQQKMSPEIVLAAYIFPIHSIDQSNAWLSWKGSRRLKFGSCRPMMPSCKLEFLEEIVYCASMTIHLKLKTTQKRKSSSRRQV